MNRIVLVDDEIHILRGLKLLISRISTDYNICGTFNNAAEALEFIKKDGTDILITDISMPNMSGLELIEKVREIDQDIHCIILSGYNDFEYARTAIKIGVVEYLLKPVDDKELREVLEKISKCGKTLTERIGLITAGGLSKDTVFIIHEIENNYKIFNLSEAAEKINRSVDHVSKVFLKETGLHINDYLREVRIYIAKQLLADNENLMIYEVSEKIGISDPVYFAKIFKKATGYNPKDYSKMVLDKNS